MTNENLIIEMLQGMQAEMKEMKQDMNQRFNAMDKRFNAMDKRFDGLENEIQEIKAEIKVLSKRTYGIGEQFESEAMKRQEADEHLSNTLKYITDKILEHDMAIHTLRNKQ